jgi:hypothetical protein
MLFIEVSLSLITRNKGRRYRWATRNRHLTNRENNHPPNSNRQKSLESIMIHASGHDPTSQHRRRLLHRTHYRDTLRSKAILHHNRAMYHSKAILRNKDIMQGQSHADAEVRGSAV